MEVMPPGRRAVERYLKRCERVHRAFCSEPRAVASLSQAKVLKPSRLYSIGALHLVELSCKITAHNFCKRDIMQGSRFARFLHTIFSLCYGMEHRVLVMDPTPSVILAGGSSGDRLSRLGDDAQATSSELRSFEYTGVVLGPS